VTEATFASAATAFARLVHDIPEATWDGPGLGEWDLRSLVGHASRSLITVSTYLQTAPGAKRTSPIRSSTTGRGRRLQRGHRGDRRARQAGGPSWAPTPATIDGLVAKALDDVAAVDDPLIAAIGGLGIRLSSYLPTRVLELAVHGLDVARAAGVDFTLPADALTDATVLAARIGVALGQGETVLMALTGRSTLPAGFSVV
jgi:uncharacterized protein (TIGR03083 family)